jgi:hypothetical protein
MEVKKDVVVKQFQIIGDTCYVLDEQGCLWISEDDGKSWRKISLPQVTL